MFLDLFSLRLEELLVLDVELLELRSWLTIVATITLIIFTSILERLVCLAE